METQSIQNVFSFYNLFSPEKMFCAPLFCQNLTFPGLHPSDCLMNTTCQACTANYFFFRFFRFTHACGRGMVGIH